MRSGVYENEHSLDLNEGVIDVLDHKAGKVAYEGVEEENHRGQLVSCVGLSVTMMKR